MKLCKDCKHAKYSLPLFVMECHRNAHFEADPVDGSVDVKGVVDCELARDPAYCEDPHDPRYCGPEGLLWEAAD